MKALGIVYVIVLVGWISNLINLFMVLISDTPLSDVGTYVILQIIGLFFAPLGAILGIASWF